MDKIPLDWPSLTVINVRAQIAEQDQTARMCSVRVKWICPKLGKPRCFLDLQLLCWDKEIYLSFYRQMAGNVHLQQEADTNIKMDIQDEHADSK